MARAEGMETIVTIPLKPLSELPEEERNDDSIIYCNYITYERGHNSYNLFMQTEKERQINGFRGRYSMLIYRCYNRRSSEEDNESEMRNANLGYSLTRFYLPLS